MSRTSSTRFLAGALALLAAGLPVRAQAPSEEKDCLTENANVRNKMQFFVCLNSKREYCQDMLLKLQTECTPASVKYAGTYNRYLVVKNKSNQLIDMLIAELKYSDKTPSDRFKQLMGEINDSTKEFDKYVQATTCDGGSNRFLPLLLPVITAALLDRTRSLMDGWLSGNRSMKEQRAAELATQRWRSPTEFGAAAPVAMPAMPAPMPMAAPVPDPSQQVPGAVPGATPAPAPVPAPVPDPQPGMPPQNPPKPPGGR